MFLKEHSLRGVAVVWTPAFAGVTMLDGPVQSTGLGWAWPLTGQDSRWFPVGRFLASPPLECRAARRAEAGGVEGLIACYRTETL
jgi:hypothetical protein